MSRFTSAQRQEILAEARATLAKPADPAEREKATPSRRVELIYKTRANGAVPRAPSERRASVASSELPWWEWVERCVDARLEAAAEGMGEVLHDEPRRG
jgi:hypothetical protein